jgi:hypothetical protein
MAFSEAKKLAVKRKSHFRCVVCRTPGVEIHHIIPQAEGGEDSIENAAPLCPTCHEIYGANPTKRKFIIEARDFWYELCEREYPLGVNQSIAELRDLVTVANSRLEGIADSLLARDSTIDQDDGNSDLNIFGVIAHILSKYPDERFPEYELLFSPLIWNKEDLPQVRENMLKEYGELFLERLALFAMRELDIPS